MRLHRAQTILRDIWYQVQCATRLNNIWNLPALGRSILNRAALYHMILKISHLENIFVRGVK